jgi:hypothetical protein
MVYYHLAILVPAAKRVQAAEGFGNGYSLGADFYPIWVSAHEAVLHHRDPYSPENASEIQIGLFGRIVDARIFGAPPEYWTFAYPAFTDILFWPVAPLPFYMVRIGFGLTLAAMTAISVVLWLRVVTPRSRSLALALFMIPLALSSYSVLEGLFAEQIGLLVGFLLAASLAALVRQRLLLAGGLLALTLIKPQVIVIVTAYLLLWALSRWKSRWKFVAGYGTVAALLFGSSLLVWPHWISEWLHVAIAYRKYSLPPLAAYVLGAQLGSSFGPILIAALLLSAVALIWRKRHPSADSFEFALTLSLLLAITSIAVLPAHAMYDHVMLLPGIILIALRWRDFAGSAPFRIVLAASALAVFWQWISAPVVVATRPFLSHDLFVSAMLTLPIRTAASIPFGVCALLSLMMWQERRRKSATDAEVN